MMAREKKPKGWYGKAAKADRKAERERRRRVRATEAALSEVRKRKRLAGQAAVEQAAARIAAKGEAGRADRRKADRDYRKQAHALRQQLSPKRADDGRGPTPHTVRHQRKTSFDHMCDAKEVSGYMAQAAEEIERVYLALCGALLSKGFSLEPRGGGRAGPISDAVAMAHARRYRPWADDLALIRKRGGWPMLEIVIDVVVEGRSFRNVERDKRLRNGAAKIALGWALIRYAVMARWTDVSELRSYERRHGVHRALADAA